MTTARDEQLRQWTLQGFQQVEQWANYGFQQQAAQQGRFTQLDMGQILGGDFLPKRKAYRGVSPEERQALLGEGR